MYGLTWKTSFLGAVALAAAASAEGPAAAECEPAIAQTMFASAERANDCLGYSAFIEACPSSPLARMADAAMTRLSCDRAKSSAAPVTPRFGTIAVLRGHSAWAVSATFSPDGTRLATASRDNTARIWNVGG